MKKGEKNGQCDRKNIINKTRIKKYKVNLY